MPVAAPQRNDSDERRSPSAERQLCLSRESSRPTSGVLEGLDAGRTRHTGLIHASFEIWITSEGLGLRDCRKREQYGRSSVRPRQLSTGNPQTCGEPKSIPRGGGLYSRETLSSRPHRRHFTKLSPALPCSSGSSLCPTTLQTHRLIIRTSSARL